MSQSQHSDFLPTLFDRDTDNLGYLIPSSRALTPSSQLTVEPFDAVDTDFLRPSNLLPIPPSLTRVGPDRRKAYVLYDDMVYQEWVDWWLQTDYGQKSKLSWDSNRSSNIWSNFDQVAHTKDGAPKVMFLETLVEHHIQDRVFGVTTDNATNNKTTVDAIQQALSSDITVIRIPCLAHVIQLCLNQLLDRLKAIPLNKNTETKWTDQKSSAAKANAQHRTQRISYTLNKRQIDYLLQITRPFFDYTTELSKTKEVTTHLVFKLYNALFDHFFEAGALLKRKRVPWKSDMLKALTAGRLKLDEYYSQTDNLKGHIYAVGTMLAPDSRFQFFLSDNWEPHWRDTYRKSFQELLIPYQERLTTSQGSTNTPTIASGSRLNKMLKSNKISAQPAGDEMNNILIVVYPIDIEPLQFWRENQSRFPAIALLARDILSIPATGAGVERLFNTARDICHYRRGRLRSETIEELMLFLCATRFNLKEAEAKQLQQFFSLAEIESAKEENDDHTEDAELDLISDNEEEEEEEGVDSRPRETSSYLIDIDIEVTEPQLPETATQIRASGRKRKSRADDDFEQY
ncbi:hypothetical protein N7505_007568 [Penicillium chrysogenum]|uniref:HAT C-terminal dimerisation domain-containing protein n=1 Tax=Penicillium chrysogenum TaxID=5076 RepID=A0ABQ8WEF8_PENCH|nr:hypothetical protein N7505_007568 [Penicillium chrysogenum]